MKKRRFDTLLFDFDGTLVLTEQIAQQEFDRLLNERGIADSARFSSKILGKTWARAFEEMRTEAALTSTDLGSMEELKTAAKSRYLQRIRKGVSLVEGVVPMLEFVTREGFFRGIVTGSDPEEVQCILEGMGLAPYFDRIWTACDYKESKPSPEPYLVALQAIGADSGKVLVFEDSPAGMESSHRAGLPWIQIRAQDRIAEDARSLKVIRDWTGLERDWL